MKGTEQYCIGTGGACVVASTRDKSVSLVGWAELHRSNSLLLLSTGVLVVVAINNTTAKKKERGAQSKGRQNHELACGIQSPDCREALISASQRFVVGENRLVFKS